MNIKETKRFFETLPNKVLFKCLTDKFVNDYDDAYDVLVKTLDKEEPYKVDKIKDGYYCKCGTFLCDEKCEEVKYCISCGQKIDW